MAQLMLINPANRPKKRRASKTAARRRKTTARANPAPRRRRRSLRVSGTPVRRRRARRNPIGVGGIGDTLMTALTGAGGALAVNAVFNLIPLPATMKTGMGATASKALLAVGVGMFGRKLIGRAAGKMAEGALTVIAYDAVKSMVPASFGGEGVAGLGYYGPAVNAGTLPGILPNASVTNLNGMGEYVSGMGEYVYQ